MLATTTSAAGSGYAGSVASPTRNVGARPFMAALPAAACTATGSMSMPDDRREPQPQRGERDHARAGAEVEQRARRDGLDELEALPRARVPAGAEGEAGLDGDVEQVVASRVPGRAHVEPPDHVRLVEAPPGVLPARTLARDLEAAEGAEALQRRGDLRRRPRRRPPARRRACARRPPPASRPAAARGSPRRLQDRRSRAPGRRDRRVGRRAGPVVVVRADRAAAGSRAASGAASRRLGRAPAGGSSRRA